MGINSVDLALEDRFVVGGLKHFILHPGRRTFARGYDEYPHSGGNTRNATAY